MRKQNEYRQIYANFYFWRNAEQREIDLIIEKNNRLETVEIKWNPNKKASLTKAFSNIYGVCSFKVINRENFFEHLF